MRFKYKAKKADGTLQKGMVEAVSRQSATNILNRNQLAVIELEEEKPIPLLGPILRLWEGVKAREFVIFARQLATLIDAKVPLISALDSVANQTQNKFFALKLRSVIVDIDGGSSLSEAMGKYPDTFSKIFVNMVKAGEASGSLQQALNDLADNTEKNYELTSKLKGAMYYPAFILTAMFVVGFLMMAFVMPKLLEILKEADVDLPLQTKILIATSDFFAAYWWAIGMVMIASVVGMFYYVKSDQGQKEFDRIILKIPIVKTIVRNVYIARFTENLSTLIQSGLPITTALAITADVVGNDVYRQIIASASEEIKRGGNIADALSKHEEIPPVVTQMVHVGESTGKIDFTLRKIAGFYMKETDRMTKNFSTLIEPVLMVILAIGVGILVSAVLLPIYQVATSIQ